MNSSKILEIFPKMEQIYYKFSESFDSQQSTAMDEAMESLLSSTKMYLQPILKKQSFKRAQNLLTALQSCILHLHLRRAGSQQVPYFKLESKLKFLLRTAKKVYTGETGRTVCKRKKEHCRAVEKGEMPNLLANHAWEKGQVDMNFKSEKYKILFLNLLSQLIDVFLLLSQTDKSFTSQAIQALHLYTENNVMDMICILLRCNLVKRSYSQICQPLLQHVLYLTPDYTLLPKEYLRCLYLLRLWGKCTKNKFEKSKIYRLASKLKISKSHAAQLNSDFSDIVAMIVSRKEQSPFDQKRMHKFFLRRKFPSGFLQQLRKVLCEDFTVAPNKEPACGNVEDLNPIWSINMIHHPNIEGHISFKSLSSDESVAQFQSVSSEFQDVSNNENMESLGEFPLFVIDTKRQETVVRLDEIAPEASTSQAAGKKSKSKKNKLALIKNEDYATVDDCHDSKEKCEKKKHKAQKKAVVEEPRSYEREKSIHSPAPVKNDVTVEGKNKKRKKRKLASSDNDNETNAKSKKQEITSLNQNIAISDVKVTSNKSSLMSSKKTINRNNIASCADSQKVLSTIPKNMKTKTKSKSKNKKPKKEGLVADDGVMKQRKPIKTSFSKKCELEFPCYENEPEIEMDENSEALDINAQEIKGENVSPNNPENTQATVGKRWSKNESLSGIKKGKKKVSTTVDCVENEPRNVACHPIIDQNIALCNLISKFKKSHPTNKEYRSEMPCNDYPDDSEEVGENKDVSDTFITQVEVEALSPTDSRNVPSVKSRPEDKNLSKNEQKKKNGPTLLVDDVAEAELGYVLNSSCVDQNIASSNLINKVQESSFVKMEHESIDGRLSVSAQQNNFTISSKVETSKNTRNKKNQKQKKNNCSIVNNKSGGKSICRNLGKTLSLNHEAEEQSYPSSVVEENKVCPKDLGEAEVPNSSDQRICSTLNVSKYLYDAVFADGKETSIFSDLPGSSGAPSNEIRNLSSPEKQAKRKFDSIAIGEVYSKKIRENTLYDINSEFREFLSSDEEKNREKTNSIYDSDGADVANDSDASESSQSKIGRSFSQRQCLEKNIVEELSPYLNNEKVNIKMEESYSISPDASPHNSSNKMNTSSCLSISERKRDLKKKTCERGKKVGFEMDEEPIDPAITLKDNKAVPINEQMSPSHNDNTDKGDTSHENVEELSSSLANNSTCFLTEVEKKLKEVSSTIVSDSSPENSFSFDLTLEIDSSGLSTELKNEFNITSDNVILDSSKKKSPLKDNSKVKGDNIDEAIVPDDKMDRAQSLIEPVSSDAKNSIRKIAQIENITSEPGDLASPAKNSCKNEMLSLSNPQTDDLSESGIKDDDEVDKALGDHEYLKYRLLDSSEQIIESAETENGVDLVENDSQAIATCVSSQLTNFKPIATTSPMKISKLPKSADNDLLKAHKSDVHNVLNFKKLTVNLQDCLNNDARSIKDGKTCGVIQRPSSQLSCHGGSSVDSEISNSYLTNTNINCISTELRHSSHVEGMSKIWKSNGLDFSNVQKMSFEEPHIAEEFLNPLIPNEHMNRKRKSSSDVIDDEVFHSPASSDCESEAPEIPETRTEKPATVEAKTEEETSKLPTETKPKHKTSDNFSMASVDPEISSPCLTNTNIDCLSTEPELCHSSRIEEKSKTGKSSGPDFSNVWKMSTEEPHIAEEYLNPSTPNKHENKNRKNSSGGGDEIYHSPTMSDCKSEALKIPETQKEKPVAVEAKTEEEASKLPKTETKLKTTDNCSMVDYSLKNMYLNSPSRKTRSALPSEDCDCKIGVQVLRRSKRTRKLSSASDRSQSESEDDTRPKLKRKVAVSTNLTKITEDSPQITKPVSDCSEKEEPVASQGYNLRTRKLIVAPSKLE